MMRVSGHSIAAVSIGVVLSITAEASESRDANEKRSSHDIRKPLGPGQIPARLSGRWKVSLCISGSHTWIRYEQTETGEIHSISRYHVFVGGWYDARHLKWHYPPTIKTGLYMDREQSIEAELQRGKFLMLSTFVDDPEIFEHDRSGGHGIVTNNCVTYARDAWYFYTGEWYELPPVHLPPDLYHEVLVKHPEAARR